jgi:hypothetical protein
VGPKAIGAVTGTRVAPGQSIQAAIDATPVGGTVVIGAGVHRGQYELRPKSRQHVVGEPGAVLDGARDLGGFAASGAQWVLAGQSTAEPTAGSPPCMAGYVKCGNPDDLFIDDVPQRRVASAAAVGAGQWFFDYAAGRIVIGTNPTGHHVEMAVPGTHAFQADQLANSASVEVRNLVVEKYGAPAQQCALMLEDTGGGWQTTADPANGTSGGWTVRDVELRLNHGCGVFAGPGTQVTGSFIHDNGQVGVMGSGRHVVYSFNEIARNNYDGHSTWWEAGGTKFWNAEQLTFSSNLVHDNNGPGAWADYSWHDIVYDHNTFLNNRGPGISQEMTMSGAATFNYLAGNDWGDAGNTSLTSGAIYIFESTNFEVAGNTLGDNNGGVVVLAQERGCFGPGVPLGQGACPPGAAHAGVQGVWVHDNDITMTKGFTGLEVLPQTDFPPYAKMSAAWASAQYAPGGVRFEYNHYRGSSFENKRGTNGNAFDDTSARFVWGFPAASSSDPRSISSWTDRRYLGFSDWQAIARQDQGAVVG